MCYNEVMKKIRFSRKTKRSKETKKTDNDIIFKRTIQDEEGNKNTFILRWSKENKGEFIKQEIRHYDN